MSAVHQFARDAHVRPARLLPAPPSARTAAHGAPAVASARRPAPASAPASEIIDKAGVATQYRGVAAAHRGFGRLHEECLGAVGRPQELERALGWATGGHRGQRASTDLVQAAQAHLGQLVHHRPAAGSPSSVACSSGNPPRRTHAWHSCWNARSAAAPSRARRSARESSRSSSRSRAICCARSRHVPSSAVSVTAAVSMAGTRMETAFVCFFCFGAGEAPGLSELIIDGTEQTV
jgi:hypothetical protein